MCVSVCDAVVSYINAIVGKYRIDESSTMNVPTVLTSIGRHL